MSEVSKKIHDALVRDDVKTLKPLLAEKRNLTLSFGRFPILSVAYLHGSERVIKAFFNDLKGISSYQHVEEYPEDYLEFKRVVGKALRLYGDKTVTPAEIASLKGYSGDAKKLLAISGTSEEADSLAELYRVKENTNLREKDGSVSAPRGKISRLAVIISLVIIIFSLTATGLAGYAYSVVPTLNGNGEDIPYSVNASEMLVSAIATDKELNCVIDSDIYLSRFTQTNCKINLNGNGHTVYIDWAPTEPLYSTISGKLENVNFVFLSSDIKIGSDKGLLAKEITGTLSSVTVTVSNTNLTLTGNAGIIAYKNSGVVTDVTVNYSGSITEVSGDESAYFGCLFSTNSGKITNAKVSLDVTATGNASEVQNSDDASKKGDYTFAGLVGENSGSISASKVSGNVSTAYVDIGGIVGNNATKGSITACVNNANLSQTTDGQFWNPNVAGIAFTNDGKLNSCTNNGAIRSTSSQASTADISAIATGLVCTNDINGTIYKCINNGTIESTTNRGSSYASGLVNQNAGIADSSRNNGDIKATSSFSDVGSSSAFSVVGGIAAANYSKITKCINKGKIDVYSGSSWLYVGGISGYNYLGNTGSVAYTAEISYCGSAGDITVTTGSSNGWMFAGGVSGYFAGYLMYTYSTANVSVPESNQIFAEALCGAIVINDYYYFPSAEYEITDCYYLNRDTFNYGVACQSRESQTGRSIVALTEGSSVIKACDTLEELKETEVYWE